jgi:hypothetical protein
VHAGTLASGLYLYLVVAEAVTKTYRATGRFLLVK